MDHREPNALRMRVALNGIEPTVWRRLVVPLTFHLGELHLVIQAAFNWCDAHLHEFRIGGLRYGVVERDEPLGGPRLFDERDVTLGDFEREPGKTFVYVYDFGDNWRHAIELEDRAALEPAPRVASCVNGARARPPEDVGGLSGYEDFLQAIADPGHDDHRAMRRWCGGRFDPDWFDVAIVDRDVRGALKPNVRRRPHQPRPEATTLLGA